MCARVYTRIYRYIMYLDHVQVHDVSPRTANASISVCASVKRGLFIWQKRPIHMEKEAYQHSHTSGMRKCQKRPIHMAKEAYSYGKRGLFIWQKRPINILIPQVCASVKRDLFIWQKRPIHMAKEAYQHSYTSGMRKCQKRPIYMAKEAYSYGKRGLLTIASLMCANVSRNEIKVNQGQVR